jgi:hypothetical protein
MDPVPDPTYHFDADLDPVFYLMLMLIRMRIQVTKMMRIQIRNTAVGWCFCFRYCL